MNIVSFIFGCIFYSFVFYFAYHGFKKKLHDFKEKYGKKNVK